MATRKRDLRPDVKGRYRPYIGWYHGRFGNEERRQPRFNLGTDLKEAERRLTRIRELYEDNCRIVKRDVWSPQALGFAKEIAHGERRIEYPTFSDVIDQDHPLLEYAQMLHNIREMYPSVDFVADPELYGESLDLNKRYVSENLKTLEAGLRQEGALPPKGELPREIIPGTLHEALDAYTQDILGHNVAPGTTETTSYGLRRLERVKAFMNKHPDIALSSLDYDACKAMVDHWRSRPPRLDGKPTSHDNSRHHVGEVIRFFKWLDSSSTYRWQMPRGLERVERKISRTDGERRLSAITKDIYTVEELAEISRHATPVERLLLYLGLNCAMGAAELGRLLKGDFLLRQAHPYADRLHFDSTAEDSFIQFLRPKTHVFGEWLLWDQTVQMVQWGLEESSRRKSDLLFVSEQGQPWYRERTKNPHSKFTNVWNRLIERVQKSHSDFRRLPVGSLRDTLPDLLRHRVSDEIASLSLAHGSPFHGDSLLDCYGNKPFGRLHSALRDIHAYFTPVFAAAPAEPTVERKHYLPIAVHEQVRALIAEGKTAPQIARECGVSAMTVYREMGCYDY
jgi:Helix-turn-helix domain of resolvase